MEAFEIARRNELDVLQVTLSVRCLTCGREWFVRLMPTQARGDNVPEYLFRCYACRREDGQSHPRV